MTELHNKLLEISQELGLATMNNEIVSSLAIKLNKKLSEAINFIPCCTELKADNKKLSFKDWNYSKGMRYLSGHTYKDNDGDLYDIDELEKMYKNYLSL